MTFGWPVAVCAIIVFVVIVAAAILLKEKSGGRKVVTELPVEGDESKYQKRQWLLDHGSEARFFGVLEAALAGGKWRVMVQVPLSKLIEPRAGLDRATAQRCRNRIDRKTVDYVVCEAGTLRPVFAVELDGSSHDATKRKERDGFVERALEGAGVKLVRFDRRGREWSVEEVRSLLRVEREGSRAVAGSLKQR